ncbi:MAG: hypothetical protein ACXAEU_07280 [Candidatus Hodarchaeales archaeon]|jgi:hypothetical protein
MPSEDLLRQLFVKKSFKNNDTGFQMSLANPLSDATIIESAKISIKSDTINEKYKDFEIESQGNRFSNKDVSKTNPFSLPVKSGATLFFKRELPLPAEKYKITFNFLSEEYGELKFKMKEKIRE